jgi:hypothetical protein
MPLYTFIHKFLNVLVQIANKMGLLKECLDLIDRLQVYTLGLKRQLLLLRNSANLPVESKGF